METLLCSFCIIQVCSVFIRSFKCHNVLHVESMVFLVFVFACLLLHLSNTFPNAILLLASLLLSGRPQDKVVLVVLRRLSRPLKRPFKGLQKAFLKAFSRPYQDHLSGLDKAYQDHSCLEACFRCRCKWAHQIFSFANVARHQWPFIGSCVFWNLMFGSLAIFVHCARLRLLASAFCSCPFDFHS